MELLISNALQRDSRHLADDLWKEKRRATYLYYKQEASFVDDYVSSATMVQKRIMGKQRHGTKKCDQSNLQAMDKSRTCSPII